MDHDITGEVAYAMAKAARAEATTPRVKAGSMSDGPTSINGKRFADHVATKDGGKVGVRATAGKYQVEHHPAKGDPKVLSTHGSPAAAMMAMVGQADALSGAAVVGV